MATDAYKNGGVIFLLWDEGSGTLGAGRRSAVHRDLAEREGAA